jgi:hypothetical protein
MALAPMHFSGSTSGKQISVTGTDTAGAVTIHTAIAGATSFDEVWIYACNTSAGPITLTIEWGGTTAKVDNKIMSIPGQSGDVCVVAGLRMNGGLLIEAFASVANEIQISGTVNRYTP